jgi:hypothetical protein
VRVNLGNLLLEEQDVAGAIAQYRTALELDPDLPEAHRGLGTILHDSDPDEAEHHLQRAFSGGASVTQPYRGKGQGVALLVLVSARGGNIPVRHWISDREFAVTALYVEFWPDGAPLPPHALIVNAIGDAERCAAALARAAALTSASAAPVINSPSQVARTGRSEICRRLAGIDGVIAPRTREVRAQDLQEAGACGFPLLLRRPGFHTGQHFLRVDVPGRTSRRACCFVLEQLQRVRIAQAQPSISISARLLT